MEIEYSNETRGKIHAYRFDKWEMRLIGESLMIPIQKLEKKIERIQNNPKNEGQATYLSQIDYLRREIKCIRAIIDEMFSQVNNQNY